MGRGETGGAQASVAPNEAREPLILALDVGTSSARAIVYDGLGRNVTGWEVHRPYAVTTTAAGGVTVDAEMLDKLVLACIDDVLAAMSGSGRRIAAVACDTFWHSLMGIDAHGAPLTPVYTWADVRSAATAAELRTRLDEAAIHGSTGCALHSSYWPAKLVWLEQSDPGTFERVAYWLSFGEFLYLRLFGDRRVSLSMASATGLFDQNACGWDPNLLDVLPVRAEQLSPLSDFEEGMRTLRPAYARRWPALHDVPWYLPLGDGACNNVGSGGFDERWAVIMIGTSGALRAVRVAPKVDIPPGLWTYRVDSDRFVQGGALSAGGNVFAWMTRTLRIDDPVAAERALADLPPEGHGLTVLPFLAGERSPSWDPKAESAIVGATLDTTPLDILQATLEGISYRFALVYDILKASLPDQEGIIASGTGLIKSPPWMQMMSDVLTQPIHASAVPEASTRGAALLALQAMGALERLSDAPVPLGATFAPNADRTEAYRAGMRRQHDLYRRLIG